MADEELLTQEEMDAIGLQADQVQVLKKCFDGFADEEGAIPADQVGGILAMMGMKVKPLPSERSLRRLMKMVLACLSLASFASWPPSFSSRRMRGLEKGAQGGLQDIRQGLYGIYPTDTLKEILRELDNKLTEDDINNIIEEVDEDGSGTLDFDEFMEMMAG